MPYLTIAAAKTAALRGDTIVLRAGTYTVGDLVKSFAVAVSSASRTSNVVTINATAHSTVMASEPADSTIDLLANPSGFVDDSNVV